MSDLKPCPFCGGSNIQSQCEDPEFEHTMFLCCMTCGGRGAYCDNMRALERMWNDRPIEERLQRELDLADASMKDLVLLISHKDRDMDILMEELREHRASLAAKQETIAGDCNTTCCEHNKGECPTTPRDYRP